MRRRRKKIFRGVALAFAVAAFAVPTAQARPLTNGGTNPAATSAAPSITLQQFRDLELRAQGINKPYGSAAASYAPQQLKALELRSKGMDERYGSTAARLTPQQLEQQLRFQGIDKRHGLIGRTTSSVQSSSAPVVVASSGSFDWGDAFVGAAATFATAIVLVAGFTAIKRREQPLGV